MALRKPLWSVTSTYPLNLSGGAWHKLSVISIAMHCPCRTPKGKIIATTLKVCDVCLCTDESAIQNGYIG
jgi:hypothetical protein